jgi:nucleotide-binding universal stress UspA family protein
MNSTFTILCPTDFSECSLSAIEFAAKLGEQYQANLVLLHIPNKDDYQKLSATSFHAGDQYSFIEKKMNNLTETVKAESLTKGLQSCSSAIVEGKIVENILLYAQEHKVDLIVMGTEGVNDFKQNFIGTRASRVAERSEIDVFLIPRKVYFKPFKKIVYATDYLEEDKIAIQKVIKLANYFESSVDYLHVSTKVKSIDKALHQTMVQEVKPFIKYDKMNYVLKSYRDEPGLGLENYLIVVKGDLLVIFSQKKPWFEQVFSKNLLRKMSYFINKPLFIIKKID